MGVQLPQYDGLPQIVHVPTIDEVVAAAQAYDYANRPKGGSWRRVPDEQVRRLLAGAWTASVSMSASAVASETGFGTVPDRIEITGVFQG